MKKRNKILFVILSVVTLLSSMVLPLMAEGFDTTDDRVMLTPSTPPSSNWLNANYSLVVEHTDSVYTVELSQTSVDLDYISLTKLLDWERKGTFSGFTKTIEVTVNASKMGNTIEKIPFTYYVQYAFQKGKQGEPYSHPVLSRIIYFNFVNEGGGASLNALLPYASKITMVLTDGFYDREEENRVFSVNYSKPVTKEQYSTISEMPQPMYGRSDTIETKPYGLIQMRKMVYKDGTRYQGLFQLNNNAFINVRAGFPNEEPTATTSTISYFALDEYDYIKQTSTGKWEWGDDDGKLPVSYMPYAEYPIFLNNSNDSPNNGIGNIYISKDIEVTIPFGSNGPEQFYPTGIRMLKTKYSTIQKFLEEDFDNKPTVLETIDVGDSFTSWIITAVSGIFGFSIAPGITIFGILGLIVTLGLFMAILKIFVGG